MGNTFEKTYTVSEISEIITYLEGVDQVKTLSGELSSTQQEIRELTYVKGYELYSTLLIRNLNNHKKLLAHIVELHTAELKDWSKFVDALVNKDLVKIMPVKEKRVDDDSPLEHNPDRRIIIWIENYPLTSSIKVCDINKNKELSTHLLTLNK